DGAGKQKHVLQHHANLAAQLAEVVLAQVLAIDQDAAFLDVVEAAQQVDNAGFARAGGPHEGDGLAGLHVEADLQGIETVGNLANGPEEQRVVHDKGNQLAFRDGARNLALRGVPHQQAHADGPEHLGHREVDAVVQHRLDVGSGVLLVYGLKLPVLALLVVENLHDVHARQVLLHEAVELGHGIAHFLEAALHLLLKHIGAEEQRRNNRQADERQLPVGVKHEQHQKDDLEQIAHHRGQALAEHVGQRFDVRDIARDEHADGRAVEKAELEAEQVPVEVGADVAHDVLAQPAAVVGLEVAHQRIHDQQRQQPHGRAVEARPVVGADVHVYHALDEGGAHGAQHGGGHGQHNQADKHTAVGLHVAAARCRGFRAPGFRAGCESAAAALGPRRAGRHSNRRPAPAPRWLRAGTWFRCGCRPAKHCRCPLPRPPAPAAPGCRGAGRQTAAARWRPCRGARPAGQRCRAPGALAGPRPGQGRPAAARRRAAVLCNSPAAGKDREAFDNEKASKAVTNTARWRLPGPRPGGGRSPAHRAGARPGHPPPAGLRERGRAAPPLWHRGRCAGPLCPHAARPLRCRLGALFAAGLRRPHGGGGRAAAAGAWRPGAAAGAGRAPAAGAGAGGGPAAARGRQPGQGHARRLQIQHGRQPVGPADAGAAPGVFAGNVLQSDALHLRYAVFPPQRIPAQGRLSGGEYPAPARVPAHQPRANRRPHLREPAPLQALADRRRGGEPRAAHDFDPAPDAHGGAATIEQKVIYASGQARAAPVAQSQLVGAGAGRTGGAGQRSRGLVRAGRLVSVLDHGPGGGAAIAKIPAHLGGAAAGGLEAHQ
nr:hypothetical protein [Tanacetum cinerariifolium]